MVRTSLQRVQRLILVLFLVTLASFFMIDLVPGDPGVNVLGPGHTPAQYRAVDLQLGLNKPFFDRYAHWLYGLVTGNLGQSLVPPQQSVSQLIEQALPVTLELAILAFLFALILSIPLGMWSAYRAGTRLDRLVVNSTSGIISVPSFLAALILIFFFVFHSIVPRVVFGAAGGVLLAVMVGRALRDRAAPVPRIVGALVGLTGVAIALFAWPSFPVQGFVRLTSGQGLASNLDSIALPAMTLAILQLALFTRVLRSDAITTLQSDFVSFARAEGMPTSHVLTREALRPSSLSLATISGVSLGQLLGGTVIVETIFGLPGMGALLISSLSVKDYPVVQACVVVIAVIYVLLNVIVDLLYGYLDPRMRRG